MFRQLKLAAIAILGVSLSACAVSQEVAKTVKIELAAIEQLERELVQFKTEWEKERSRAFDDFLRSVKGFWDSALFTAQRTSSLEATDRLFRLKPEEIDSTRVSGELREIYSAQVKVMGDVEAKEAKLKAAFSERLGNLETLRVQLSEVKKGVKRAGQSAEIRKQIATVLTSIAEGLKKTSE